MLYYYQEDDSDLPPSMKGESKMRKGIEITLRNKKNGITQTYFCHHYSADSRAYYLQGVKGCNDPLGIGLAFNKAEWERV